MNVYHMLAIFNKIFRIYLINVKAKTISMVQGPNQSDLMKTYTYNFIGTGDNEHFIRTSKRGLVFSFVQMIMISASSRGHFFTDLANKINIVKDVRYNGKKMYRSWEYSLTNNFVLNKNLNF